MFRRLDKIYVINNKGYKKYGIIKECHMNETGKMFYSCDFGNVIIKLADHQIERDTNELERVLL